MNAHSTSAAEKEFLIHKIGAKTPPQPAQLKSKFLYFYRRIFSVVKMMRKILDAT